MGHIDYKATVWFRIPVEDEKILKKVIEKLNKGDLVSDLYQDVELSGAEILYETEEFIRPIENDNQSTIEVFEFKKIDNCTQPVLAWDNSFESEVKRKLNEDRS